MYSGYAESLDLGKGRCDTNFSFITINEYFSSLLFLLVYLIHHVHLAVL